MEGEACSSFALIECNVAHNYVGFRLINPTTNCFTLHSALCSKDGIIKVLYHGRNQLYIIFSKQTATVVGQPLYENVTLRRVRITICAVEDLHYLLTYSTEQSLS